ncbi:hypothetical protein WA158_006487 [Blastocystis sp. Blastoise]
MEVPSEAKYDVMQDVQKEQTMEEDVYMQENHKPMRQWFNEKPDFKEKYGRFPAFWQDLKEWENWGEVKKIYIQEREKEEKKKARKEKRKLRWSTIATSKPKTRWELDERKPEQGLATNVANKTVHIEELQIIVLRVRMREITNSIQTVEEDAERISNSPDKSPSPPPLYDAFGTRTNTRAIRMRKKLEEERADIMDAIVKLNPVYKSIVPKQKCQRKVFIPFKEYPNYNFVSLVIGPRGNTQKQLETETHCKIEARGKGIVQKSKKRAEEQVVCEEEGHFLITGENEADVDACANYIAKLMIPVSDEHNLHKQRQLRELALINGTVRQEAYCTICGQQGHRMYDCPQREASFTKADVRCRYCGETTHISSDCPHKNDPKSIEMIQKMNSTFENFLNEIDGKKESPITSPITTSPTFTPSIPTTLPPPPPQPWMNTLPLPAPTQTWAPPPWAPQQPFMPQPGIPPYGMVPMPGMAPMQPIPGWPAMPPPPQQ